MEKGLLSKKHNRLKNSLGTYDMHIPSNISINFTHQISQFTLITNINMQSGKHGVT